METKKAERTCIVCGMKAQKQDLMRVVRTPSCQIRLDRSGNAAGRGAYFCSVECFDKAIAQNKLSRALRMRTDDCDIDAIRKGLVAAQ